jgi:molybdenum cofactor synthesis domain-containing protein
MTTAGVLIIGDEILSGKIQDQNGPFLAQHLRERGVDLVRLVMVGDDVQAIASDVRDMAGRFDVVLTSGGIGSTHDDVTFEGVAAGLGLPVVVHDELVARIRSRTGAEPDPSWDRMVRLPQGSSLVDAEGYPLVRVQNVFVFPGVPRFLRAKMAALHPWLGSSAPYRVYRVFLQAAEPQVSQLLQRLDARHPEVKLGSYPKFEDEDHRLEITVESREDALAAAVRDELVAGVDPAWIVRLT